MFSLHDLKMGVAVHYVIQCLSGIVCPDTVCPDIVCPHIVCPHIVCPHIVCPHIVTTVRFAYYAD